MTTYTTIPNSDVDTDSPITTSLMTLMRDNPIAISEGATSAPRILRGAISPGVGHKWFFDYGDGSDGASTWTTSSKAPGLYQYTTLTLSAANTVTLSARGPLVICATTSITINGTLNVDGMGALGGIGAGSPPPGDFGMFGGSGGGSVSVGGGSYLTAGGAASTAGASQSAQTKALLLALMPLFNIDIQQSIEYASVGGGGGGASNSGGQDGGNGGGVIVLCAPQITVGAAGVITADGSAGSGNGSGGGGGAIIVATPTGGYTNGGSVAANAGTGFRNGGAGWVKAVVL